MEKDAVRILLWIFAGALVVLVVTHASGFATATNAVGGQITNDAFLLSGGAGSHAPGSYNAASAAAFA